MNVYCKKHNIALTPWSPNSQGILTRPLGTTTERFSNSTVIPLMKLDKLSTADESIVNRVEILAKKKRISMAVLATSWVFNKGCSPIVGMSSISRVDDAIHALDVSFTEEELRFLEELYTSRPFY